MIAIFDQGQAEAGRLESFEDRLAMRAYEAQHLAKADIARQ
jgi:hypothetical protein